MLPGENVLEDAKTFSYEFLRRKQANNQLLDKWIIMKDLPGEVCMWCSNLNLEFINFKVKIDIVTEFQFSKWQKCKSESYLFLGYRTSNKQVEYALDIPWYASLPRLETCFYLDQYGGEDDVWIGKTLYRYSSCFWQDSNSRPVVNRKGDTILLKLMPSTIICFFQDASCE